jgi:hypothetical protein
MASRQSSSALIFTPVQRSTPALITSTACSCARFKLLIGIKVAEFT